MKRPIIAFLFGMLAMLIIGAATDPGIRDLNDSVKRIAKAVEKIAGDPQR